MTRTNWLWMMIIILLMVFLGTAQAETSAPLESQGSFEVSADEAASLEAYRSVLADPTGEKPVRPEQFDRLLGYQIAISLVVFAVVFLIGCLVLADQLGLSSKS